MKVRVEASNLVDIGSVRCVEVSVVSFVQREAEIVARIKAVEA